MIDSYRFGQIVIDKIPYRKDVIIFPDHVQPDWWRKSGHKLLLVDIQNEVEGMNPEILVVGTGAFGILEVSQEVKDFLEEKGITLYEEVTGKAIKIYNRLILLQDKILGAFHLTC